MNRLKTLQEYGQAVWLDYIRRDLLNDGSLASMVSEDGVTGVTSNPAIFNQAIAESSLYDAAMRSTLESDADTSVVSLYEELAVQDIQRATEILKPVYEATARRDGYVSLEVSPHLARDTEGTIAEARRLWQWVERENLMIKVPATEEGVPAIEQLLAEGINVNVTLMFSLAHYEAVAQAYLRAVERHPDPARVASVASFFVSRVDSKLDPILEKAGLNDLMGRTGIANSKVAYARYRELFEGPGFEPLAAKGARPQRVLWASTSTKNPDYRDVLYVEELIGPNTVNTIPPATLEAFRDHGVARASLLEDVDGAFAHLAALQRAGIDLNEATEELQREGVEAFVKPFDSLLATLRSKRDALVAA